MTLDCSAQMRNIRDVCGAQIQKASEEHGIPAAFLAALIANESNAKSDAKRFEKGVFEKLALVAIGEKESYSGITAGMIYPEPAKNESCPQYGLRLVRLLRDAATSWGWTQIMGYHMLRWQQPIQDLLDKGLHLNYAARLLSEFMHNFHLGMDESAKLARCWNTGSPDPSRPTYDPAYIPNLLARMEAWQSLGQQ